MSKLELILDGVFLVGYLLVAAGWYAIYPPAALLWCGGVLMVLAIMLARGIFSAQKLISPDQER